MYQTVPAVDDSVPHDEQDPPENSDNQGHPLTQLNVELLSQFVKGYQEDPYFRDRYNLDRAHNRNEPLTPSRFERAKNGLLYFIDASSNTRVCVPRTLVETVLKWIHEPPYESAHAGVDRFTHRVQRNFFWPKLRHSCENFVKTCDSCQKNKTENKKPEGALQPLEVPLHPFHTFSLDLITGLPPSGEEQFTAILVIVDKLTKYGIAVPTFNSLDKQGFAEFFVNEVICRFGMPEKIVADRDKRWATDFWKSVFAHFGGIMALSSAHHPQTDGQTENLNAQIEVMLRAYVSQDRGEWSKWIRFVMRAYNSSVHSSTGYQPDFLLMGYHPEISTTIFSRDHDPSERPFLPSQEAKDFVRKMELRRNFVKDAILLAQERQAKAYNKKRRMARDIKEGDYVLVNPHSMELVEAEGTGKKLVQRGVGPFEVSEVIGPSVLRLRLPASFPMHPVINREHLRLYHSSGDEFGERSVLPDTRQLKLNHEEYEVEAILGHKLGPKSKGRKRLYRVRWEGYGPEDDTWEDEYALRNSFEILRDYQKMHALR
jgi:hypothetical protein